MNKLPFEKQVQVIQLLLDGVSLMSVSKQADVSINTTTKLLLRIGQACEKFHNIRVKGLPQKQVVIDQIWSVRGPLTKKQLKNWQGKKSNDDIWTWIAVGRTDNLVLSWLVGRNDSSSADAIVKDILSKTCDTGELVWKSNRQILNPADPVHQSRSQKEPYIAERADKISNFFHALALHFVYFNFCKLDQESNMTPAMRAGIMQTVMNVEDIIGLLETKLAGH